MWLLATYLVVRARVANADNVARSVSVRKEVVAVG